MGRCSTVTVEGSQEAHSRCDTLGTQRCGPALQERTLCSAGHSDQQVLRIDRSLGVSSSTSDR